MKKVTFSIILLSCILVLGLAWYLLSPLFIDKIVEEERPIFIIMQENSSTQEETPSWTTKATFSNADSFHKTSGEVYLFEKERLLRLEQFQTTNGPDLYVYLANDLEATSFINLGELKGNIGNQNYYLPENTSLENYPYVLIWCKQFSVLFGWAKMET